MLWTCIHSVVSLSEKSCNRIYVLYLCSTTKCLSKLHDSLFRILLALGLLSKIKRNLWSPRFWILKPFLTLQIGLKVLATASIFKVLCQEIRHKGELLDLIFFFFFFSSNFISSPSLSNRGRSFQASVISFMTCNRRRKNNK